MCSTQTNTSNHPDSELASSFAIDHGLTPTGLFISPKWRSRAYRAKKMLDVMNRGPVESGSLEK